MPLLVGFFEFTDQFVAALKANNIPVTYILYPDEGHGFRKPENALAQAGFVEKFLHGCIHGEYEEFNLRQHNSSAMVSFSTICRVLILTAIFSSRYSIRIVKEIKQSATNKF